MTIYFVMATLIIKGRPPLWCCILVKFIIIHCSVHDVISRLSQVDWDAERECFRTFSHEYSCFYSIRYDPFLLESSERTAAVGGSSGSAGDGSGKSDEMSSQLSSQGDGTEMGEKIQVYIYYFQSINWH